MTKRQDEATSRARPPGSGQVPHLLGSIVGTWRRVAPPVEHSPRVPVCFFAKMSKPRSKAAALPQRATGAGSQSASAMPTATLHRTRPSAMQFASMVRLQPRLERQPPVTTRSAATRTCLGARGDAANGAAERGWCLCRVSARAGTRSSMLCS